MDWLDGAMNLFSQMNVKPDEESQMSALIAAAPKTLAGTLAAAQARSLKQFQAVVLTISYVEDRRAKNLGPPKLTALPSA